MSIQKISVSIKKNETGEMGEGRWGKVVGRFYYLSDINEYTSEEDRYLDGNLVQTLPAKLC